jgi:hypothetical protein
MKIFRTLFVFAVTSPSVDIVRGFSTVSSQLLVPVTSSSPSSFVTTRLYGLFDFKPFHGQGSGEGKNDLDSQWAIQQEILAARRGNIDKSALKKKYANGARGDLSSLGGGNSSGTTGRAAASTNDRRDEMYVESPKKKGTSSKGGTGASKFFWEK